MKVGTPLGVYSFKYRRLERREEGIAIVGLVAGMEASVVVEAADLRKAARWLGPPLALLGLVVAARRARA